MARSSRHKSHRQHRDRPSREGRDRSESEEEERDSRAEEPKTRVFRDSEAGKKKSSGRDLAGPGDDDFVEEHGRKRKDKAEDSGRWNGGEDDDGIVDKGLRNEDIEDSKMETKATVLVVDSGSRSSRRIEGSVVEKNEDSGGKRWIEKDSSRRESSSQHKETKEKERERRLEEDFSRRGSSSQYRDARERDSERRSVDDSSRRESSQYKKNGKERDKDQRSEEGMSWRESINQYKDAKDRDRDWRSERDNKKILDGGHDKSDDVANRKQANPKEKKNNDDSECQTRDYLRNPELEKELEKRTRRRDGSGDKEKCTVDHRDYDDQRQFSKDDQPSADNQPKNGSYKDERHRDRHQGDYDKDHRRHDNKYRDEHSSRNHSRDRSESKQHREDNVSESPYKKSKLQDGDLDGSPYFDECDSKFKERRGRKRSSDETDGHSDCKPRNAKESRGDRDRTASGSNKVDSQVDGTRIDHAYSDKVDCHLSTSGRKGSPSYNACGAKDRTRHTTKQPESSLKGSPSGERLHFGRTSTGDHGSFSGVRGRDAESLSSGKNKLKDDIHYTELLESAAASQYDRTPRSDTHTSSVHSVEKSPSTSDWRSSDKADLKSSQEIQKPGQRNPTSNEGKEFSLEDKGFELPSEKLIMENHSRTDKYGREIASIGQSSFQKTGHLPPPPPMRHGIDSPSVLGTYEDDTRVQSADRKSSSRYNRRGSDPGMGRAHGNAWNVTSTWPSPAANGFIPLQPPPTGFHPAVQQFPSQPLFSVRPSLDLHHSGVPYNIHDTAERFPGHVRPFSWHNPVGDSCPPHLQVWDGSNGMFAEETHVYGRTEWDQNRRMIENGGWEWKGQYGNMNVEFSAPQKESEYTTHSSVDETWVGQSGNWLPHEQAELECSPAEVLGGKQQSSVNTPLKTSPERKVGTSKSGSVPQSSKTSNEDTKHLCCSYISKLDISANLARTELFEQCASLLEKRDGISENKVSKNSQLEDNKTVLKTPNYILNAFFPKAPDSIFQRAMSLYKKQIESVKVKNLVTRLVYSDDTKGSAEMPDAEKVPDTEKVDEGVRNQTSPELENTPDMDKLNPECNQTCSGDTIQAHTNSAGDMEEENNTRAGVEGDLTHVDVNEASGITPDAVLNESSGNTPDVVLNESSGNTPDAVIVYESCGITPDAVDVNEASDITPDAVRLDEASIVTPDTVDVNEASAIKPDVTESFLNSGSDPCEDLMQECGENFNRIHNSPESTH